MTDDDFSLMSLIYIDIVHCDNGRFRLCEPEFEFFIRHQFLLQSCSISGLIFLVAKR